MVYGEPDEWEFDYPFDFLQIAYWLWAMSDYKHLPSQDDIAKYDPRYISDMRLMVQISSHQRNNSPLMRMFENWQAYNSDPEAYRKNEAALKASERNDSALLKGKP
jgi:hypothetical protein